MFEVLAFVFENYWGGDSCPELPALQRKLNAVGFDNQEIMDALLWLEDLKSATHALQAQDGTAKSPDAFESASQRLNACKAISPDVSMRVFTKAEQIHIGVDGWGFVAFLVSIGTLPCDRLELVMERVMAAPGNPVSMDDLKLIVLMVFWSLGEEPDALLLDELCDHRSNRLAH